MKVADDLWHAVAQILFTAARCAGREAPGEGRGEQRPLYDHWAGCPYITFSAVLPGLKSYK